MTHKGLGKIADDQDREAFLATLHRVADRYNWLCRAYCLMDNHYHLLIETPDGNLSLGMRQLNGVYTQLFNRRHSRVGHLFQGRFKAIVVQKDSHLLEACRYVVLNPVRAKIVKSPHQMDLEQLFGHCRIPKCACMSYDRLDLGTICITKKG